MHVVNKEDWVVIITFLGSFICLYGSFAFLVGRAIFSPKQRRPALGVSGFLVIVITVFTWLCIGYAYFVEPNNLEITTINLSITGLKAPLVIVQVSDSHCDPTPRLESRVVEEIERLKPDLIFFTGDGANSIGGIPIFNDFIHRLIKIAPTYGVKGDWDFAIPNIDPLSQSGLNVLNGRTLVTINGTKICLLGTESGSDFVKLDKLPAGMPVIVLYHNPDANIVFNGDLTKVDLYLCGHTHGGQIALPFYGALITQSKQGKKFESGLHRVGKTWFYTNRGIGMEGHFPRLRFFSRPELTVFKLLPG